MSPRTLIVCTGLAILSGCATLDEGECRTADWYELGSRDGLAGQPLSRLHEHRKACAEYGVAPVEQRYRDGRDAGLREYCRLDNAVRLGLKGERYEGVCPPHIDPSFRDYNDAAYAVHQTKAEIGRIDALLDDKEKQLLDKKLSDAKRNELRKEIREQDRKRDNLRDELRQQERQLDWMMDEARRLGR